MRRREKRNEAGKETDDQVICTLAACFPLLGLFLAVEEIRDGRKSRLAHFSVCSAAVMLVHVLWALLLLGVSQMMHGVPILGFVTELVLWILYLTGAIALIIVRVSMMHAAWQDLDYELPVLGRWLEDRFHR